MFKINIPNEGNIKKYFIILNLAWEISKYIIHYLLKLNT